MGLKNNHLNNIQGRKGSQFSSQLRGINLERVLVVAIDAAKFFQKALSTKVPVTTRYMSRFVE